MTRHILLSLLRWSLVLGLEPTVTWADEANRRFHFLRPSANATTTASTTATATTSSRSLIWKGESVEEGEFPWFVELFARNGGTDRQRFCAGVMISGSTFITTARCTYTLDGVPANPKESIAVIKREETKRGKGEPRYWNVVREHPNHNYPSPEWNIAVVTIAGSELFPQQDIGDFLNPAPRSEVIGIGYGEKYPLTGLSDKLRKSTYQILPGGSPFSRECPIPSGSGKTLVCIDTIGRLDAEEEQAQNAPSEDQDNREPCDFTDPKFCPPTPAPTVDPFVPDGDVDFCLGDEGAPLTRTDRQLYGLYLEGGNCDGRGPNAALVVKTGDEDVRSWILATACEIGETRCASACGLFSATATEFAGAMRSIVGATGAAWNWMVGSPTTSTGGADSASNGDP